MVLTDARMWASSVPAQHFGDNLTRRNRIPFHGNRGEAEPIDRSTDDREQDRDLSGRAKAAEYGLYIRSYHVSYRRVMDIAGTVADQLSSNDPRPAKRLHALSSAEKCNSEAVRGSVRVECVRSLPPPEELIMARVLPVATAEFGREVLFSPIPVVVDFYADWCGPCRVMTPVLEHYAAAYDGAVKFAKVDVDKEPDLACHYDVSSIPTLLFFRDNQLSDRMTGLPAAALMRAKLDALTQQPAGR